MTNINQKSHIEWSKHPELLREIGELREKEIPFPEIATILGYKYDLNVHGDTIRSAYKRHREFIRREMHQTTTKVERKMAHKGKLAITTELLEKILKISEDVSIEGVSFNQDRGIIELLLTNPKGNKLPEKVEGSTIMNVNLEDIM